MANVLRTPNKLISAVPDFPFKPRYRQYAGLRLAHVDEGKGPPVVFIHGEPTWSFLWRKVIPPVRDAGFRCIAPDLPGFGRSDKPLDSWMALRELARSSADLPIAFLMRAGCKRELAPAVTAAHEAPFPDPAAKAGARAFPLVLPTSPQMNGAGTGRRVLEALSGDSRPKLIIWGEADPILPLDVGWRFARAIGAQIDHVIPGAGHFVQEDAGPQVGRLIATWLKAQFPRKR